MTTLGDSSDRCFSLEEELTASGRALLPLVFEVQGLDLHERCFPLFVGNWLFGEGHGCGGRQCFLALGGSHFDVNGCGLETSERREQSRTDGEKKRADQGDKGYFLGLLGANEGK